MIVNKKGILMALGNFPEGNATATRLKFIAKSLNLGGMPVLVALLQATLKDRVPENSMTFGEVEGIRFLYLNGRTVRPRTLFAAVLDTLQGISGALRLLMFSKSNEQADFAIFYTPSFLQHVLPMMVAYIRHIPIFVEACEIRSKSVSGSERQALGRMFDFTEKWMEFLSSHIASGIIPISNQIANFYRKKGVSENRLFLLPILVDADIYSQPSNAKIKILASKTYFLNSGSFVEKDGVNFVVEAFINVALENHNLYLVFTGSVCDQNKKKVIDSMEKAGIFERVIFPGMLSRAELIWAYQHAIGLLSCRTNSAYANFGFPTKVGEYLATGVPVIATSVGDIDVYLKHEQSALLAIPENTKSIAQCMRFIINNPDVSRQIGLQGKQIAAQKFHYASYSDQLTQFIRERIELI